MPIYHVSNIPDMKVLEPRVGTHGKAWIYATKNLALALTFGAKWNDFDFSESVDSNGKVYLDECYKGSFDEIFKDKSCSIYEIEDSGFEVKTSFKAEIVSEKPAKVLKETKVTDLILALREEEKKGNIVINAFDEKWYKEFLEGYLIERFKMYNYVNAPTISELPSNIQKHHSKLYYQLQKDK